MPISLSTPRAAPAARLPAKGSYLSGHVVHQEVIPWTEMSTDGRGAVKVGNDGKPRNQLRLTLVVVAGDAEVKDGDDHRPVVAGEEVSVYLKGHRWGAWIEATKRNGANIGDIVTIRFDRTENGKVAGTTKHVYTVAIDHGVPDEVRGGCETRYHELERESKDRKRNPRAQQEAQADDAGGDDDVPFAVLIGLCAGSLGAMLAGAASIAQALT